MKGTSFWEILIYLSLFYIIFYALAKGFGWIKTPELISQSPYIAGAIFGIGIYKWFTDIFARIDERFAKIEKNIIEIKTRCDERSKYLYRKK